MKRCLFFLLFSALIPLSFSAQVQFDGMKEINGTQIYCRVIGKGDPLVIIHGGPGLNQSYFGTCLDGLAKHYTLIFYDQRSSGKSAMVMKENMSMGKMVEDLEGIRQAFGYEKINLFAHSFGGLIATEYAKAHPEHVQSLIYCNSVPLSHDFDYYMNNNIEAKTSKADSLEKIGIMKSESFQKGEVSSIEKLMMLGFKTSFCDTSKLKEFHPSLPSNYYAASTAFLGMAKELTKYNYYDDVKKFTFPVLIIHGNCDVMPIQSDEKLHENIPGSQLIIFEESGHFPFIEENKKFIKTIRSFLD